jgi:hypothetical protein
MTTREPASPTSPEEYWAKMQALRAELARLRPSAALTRRRRPE